MANANTVKLFKATYAQTRLEPEPDGGKVRVSVLDAAGKPVMLESDNWTGYYDDLAGKRRKVTLCKDAELSRRSLAALNDALQRVRSNMPVKPDEVPLLVRDTYYSVLKTAGHRDGVMQDATRPLAVHLADWERSLAAAGNTPKHVAQVVTRARRMFDVCRFTHWHDLNASRLQTGLADLRYASKKKGTPSVQTRNFHLQAVKQFAAWMLSDGRAFNNPVTHVKGGNVKTDRRHDRRALEADELRRLIAAADSDQQPERYGMTGRWPTALQPRPACGRMSFGRSLGRASTLTATLRQSRSWRRTASTGETTRCRYGPTPLRS